MLGAGHETMKVLPPFQLLFHSHVCTVLVASRTLFNIASPVNLVLTLELNIAGNNQTITGRFGHEGLCQLYTNSLLC